jgi:ArsR family transcriptional regulator, arsenate/arsenite/antimonite-responsive transcriptional repressor
VLLDQRQGQWVYYRLNPDLPVWANEILKVIAQDPEIQKLKSTISTSCELS